MQGFSLQEAAQGRLPLNAPETQCSLQGSSSGRRNKQLLLHLRAPVAPEWSRPQHLPLLPESGSLAQHYLPAHIPTKSLDTMIISNDRATSLHPIKIAGTMEKMLLKSKVPFLQRMKCQLVQAEDSFIRLTDVHQASVQLQQWALLLLPSVIKGGEGSSAQLGQGTVSVGANGDDHSAERIGHGEQRERTEHYDTLKGFFFFF